MRLRDIKKYLRRLNLRQLRKLESGIHEMIASKERNNDPGLQPSSKPIGRYGTIDKTYRLEYIRCGKHGCKCAKGQLHVPYWYAYWSEGGKTKSLYVGKRLPKGVKLPRETKSRNVR